MWQNIYGTWWPHPFIKTYALLLLHLSYAPSKCIHNVTLFFHVVITSRRNFKRRPICSDEIQDAAEKEWHCFDSLQNTTWTDHANLIDQLAARGDTKIFLRDKGCSQQSRKKYLPASEFLAGWISALATVLTFVETFLVLQFLPPCHLCRNQIVGTSVTKLLEQKWWWQNHLQIVYLVISRTR